jgi:Ser/Thr protein kinase RdoA (MazF antagonist)
VTAPPLDPARAEALARSAAAAWDLESPELLRVGMTAIYTAGASTVLRVHRPNGDPSASVRLAEELLGSGIRVPAPRCAEVLVDHDADGATLAVAAFERIGGGGPVDWEAVGAMVRRVHALDPAVIGALHPMPWCGDVPWWNVERLLDDAADDLDGGALDSGALDGMCACWERHRSWAGRVVERVVCHGDVHPGNVLSASDGPVLIDWDLLCVGPRAWDHAPLATWSSRWGGPADLVERFRAGYGASFEGDPVGDALAELRLLVATLMRVRAGRTNPAARAEAERRLRWWRGDPAAPQWQAM